MNVTECDMCGTTKEHDKRQTSGFWIELHPSRIGVSEVIPGMQNAGMMNHGFMNVLPATHICPVCVEKLVESFDSLNHRLGYSRPVQ